MSEVVCTHCARLMEVVNKRKGWDDYECPKCKRGISLNSSVTGGGK